MRPTFEQVHASVPVELCKGCGRPEQGVRYRRVLTDDDAPIEWITDLALLEALR